MGYVNLSAAREKMVITEDIRNARGVVIVGKGAVLTSAIIDKLKRLKIPGLAVHEVKPAGNEVKPAGNRDDLEDRFSLVRGDPIMEELLAAVRAYDSEKDTGNGE